jgi:hypothetical protein
MGTLYSSLHGPLTHLGLGQDFPTSAHWLLRPDYSVKWGFPGSLGSHRTAASDREKAVESPPWPMQSKMASCISHCPLGNKMVPTWEPLVCFWFSWTSHWKEVWNYTIWFRPGLGKVWPIGQIQPVTCFSVACNLRMVLIFLKSINIMLSFISSSSKAFKNKFANSD